MHATVQKVIKKIALGAFGLGLVLSSARPCTVIVASGKATPDGKPLMWKNRDASDAGNKMMYVRGSKFGFVALVEAAENEGREAWAGVNSQGFCIMNTASADLLEEGNKSADENGSLMARALGECANVAAFESLLTQTNGQRQTASNYCVIDAEGNACVFETSRSGFAKFDTKDLRVAPFGYLIRTNYAYSAGGKSGGGGYIRFDRASNLAQTAVAEKNLTPKFVLQSAARDLVNEKLLSDPWAVPLPRDPATPLYIVANDTISRASTVSAALFHGVASPDKAALTTMWVLLGQPVMTAAVPLWAAAEKVPAVMSGPKSAPMNDLARALTPFLFPDRRSGLTTYLNISRLRTYGGEGVLPKLFRIEDPVFQSVGQALKDWDKAMPPASKVFEFEDGLASGVLNSLRAAFPDLR
jgi:hypothetical protein